MHWQDFEEHSPNISMMKDTDLHHILFEQWTREKQMANGEVFTYWKFRTNHNGFLTETCFIGFGSNVNVFKHFFKDIVVFFIGRISIKH